jgi:hypothetical protein
VARGPSSGFGVWAARVVGTVFVVMGVGAVCDVLILWIDVTWWGLDVAGTLMIVVGACQIALRGNARKAGIVIGAAHVCGSIWALWMVAQLDQGWRAALTNLTVAVVMAAATAALLLPATRDAFERAARHSADDEPLLNVRP